MAENAEYDIIRFWAGTNFPMCIRTFYSLRLSSDRMSWRREMFPPTLTRGPQTSGGQLTNDKNALGGMDDDGTL